MRALALAAVLCMAVISSAYAQAGPPIEISHAWSRATPASAATGVVYLKVVNHGTADDRLTGASTAVASKAELHITLNDNGVMKMRPLADVPVKAGGSAEFKPDGMHIMLLGLKHPLKAGDHFPLTLTFEKAGAVKTMVTVQKAGAAAPGSMPGMKM
jgi:periplasmic copper chaperone A